MTSEPRRQPDITNTPASRGLAVRPRRSLQRTVITGLVRGLAGGVVATAAMSAVMLAAQKAGLLGEMPPEKITGRLLAAAGLRRKTPEGARQAFSMLLHFAFGGASGAAFGVAHELWRTRSRTALRRSHARRVPLLAGLAFGTAIWASSYAGWVPALRIMPMPQRDRRGRPTSMVLAHWVFGAVLAKVVAR